VAATIDATLQGASANSYVTLAEADAYFQTVPHDEHWTGSDDKKNRVLITATRYLDNFEYYGIRCTTTQALKWPRKDYKVDGVEIKCTFIPEQVKNATFELAHVLLYKGEALVGTTGTQGTYDRVELGDLKVKFKESSQTPGVINNILDVYPWLESFLGAYMKSGATNYAVELKRG
tara:strand:- start:19535 stop:20062 length:528 start_codon:yes stop_codon:yes gene_type:complete